MPNITASMWRIIRDTNEKPNYTLSDYNCTKFAKEIADEVGVSFPKGASVFPAEASKGFRQKIFSPNRLFTSMQGMQEKGAGNISAESSTADFLEQGRLAQQQQQEEEAQARIADELVNHQQYDIVRSTDFWPGEQFGNEDTVRFEPLGDYRAVWSLGVEQEFQDPDERKMMGYTKVKAVIRGAVCVGWIRSDRISPARV